MSRLSDAAWWYWLATVVLLTGWLCGCNICLYLTLMLCLVQIVHFSWHRQSVTAFPVQVRLAYLALLIVGLSGPLRFVHWIQLVGTSAVVAFDYCLLARIVSLLPWNRAESLTAGLVRRTLLARPVRGDFVDSSVGAALSPEHMCSLHTRPTAGGKPWKKYDSAACDPGFTSP